MTKKSVSLLCENKVCVNKSSSICLAICDAEEITTMLNQLRFFNVKDERLEAKNM